MFSRLFKGKIIQINLKLFSVIKSVFLSAVERIRKIVRIGAWFMFSGIALRTTMLWCVVFLMKL